MSRRTLLLVLALSVAPSAEATLFKCRFVDSNPLAAKSTIVESTVPKGVEFFDRAWMKNPTATEFITFTPEKGAEARTRYREILGPVPTTRDELPGMKLVSGEHYEYHYPANPVYTYGEHEERILHQGGWVKQDYAAGLVVPPAPKLPPEIVSRILSGKTKSFATKVRVPYYFGRKKGAIEVVYEFTKNPNLGKYPEGCPTPSATPSASAP